jgi:hypothetical protein
MHFETGSLKFPYMLIYTEVCEKSIPCAFIHIKLNQCFPSLLRLVNYFSCPVSEIKVLYLPCYMMTLHAGQPRPPPPFQILNFQENI